MTTMLVDAPGIYNGVSADCYHGDCCLGPSLSSSIAQKLINQSPRHAWFAHPKLNLNCVPDDSRRMDLGTLAHTLLIGQGRDIVEIDATDYRKKDAQEKRDEARNQGKTPALKADLVEAKAMAQSAREQLATIKGCEHLFDPKYGQGEVLLAWKEGEAWCRALVDWLPHDRHYFVDYKTTSGSAHPNAVAYKIADMSYELQVGFYERALLALESEHAGHIEPLFIFQETDPPYLLSAVTLDEGAREVGRDKVAKAIRLWQRCLEDNNWPGYPGQITTVMYPTFAHRNWEDRQAQDYLNEKAGYDPFSLLAPWAPKQLD